MRRGIPIVVALVAVLLPLTAEALILNGDFEMGGNGWTPDACPGWTFTFPPAGGNPNGHARIQSPFGNSGGLCGIRQQFLCGDPPAGAHCEITFDFKLDAIDASPLSARIKVLVDGALVFVTPPADHIPWTMGAATVPCGLHTIQLLLEVDPGNNGWAALFDNVQALCVPPLGVAPSTWSVAKVLYQ